MRVAQSWLTDIIARTTPDWSVTPEELDAGFVRVGLEVEEVDTLERVGGEIDKPLVVGRVLEITELTEFKKPIRFCKVDVGNPEPQEIVCGARNFAVGDLVVVVLPGGVLPGGFAISSRKTYGHVSNGMICSVAELGIGKDHSGILVLEPGTAEPGADANELLGLDDTVIELNITPDRGYCFSVRGLARELACGFDLEYADPAVRTLPDDEADAWPVRLEPASQCTRFAVRRVTGIDPDAVSPWWLQRRLLLSGVRPISPAVDVTNYVMLELGQPLHAFDAAKLSGGLVVRPANAGETLRTLDDTERTLDAEDVVIADDSGVISLAGVMGGASTEVSAESTDIVLEAATWNPLLVYRTARRHKLVSEASKRYERVVDPEINVAALDRAATLLAEIAGGTIESALTDIRVPLPATEPIHMDIDLADRVAGVTYPTGTSARRLAQIGCTVEVDVPETGHGQLVVTPPSWRPDLAQPADLVEEVLRLEGLEQIPSVLPAAPAGRGLTPTQRRRRAVSRALAFAGCAEVPPPVFLPAGVFDTWGLDADDPRRTTTRVLNPLDVERPELATTLLPGLLEVAGRNISRGAKDLAIYGIAQVVLPGPDTRPIDPLPVDRRPTDDEVAELLASLPDQPVHVAAVLSGRREPRGPWGDGRPAEAADAFALADAVADAAGVVIERRAGAYLPWHPGRCAELVVDGMVVGHAGELHPAVLERSGLPPRTCAFELNLDALPLREDRPVPVVSPFPAVLQDVSVSVEKAVPAAQVETALRSGGGELLEDITLFDVYEGAQAGEGRKSLTYALRFRAPDRTLTEDEASAARDAAVSAASEAVGAVLRG
ncbi:phenylalanine--tRNA ligase subunit beta [Nocardia cyriacigeorgica]|uniref:Phenylalanine--tRNA ligase beta subunit n=1 Tax=Nocardia cyriacigeorgica (strain GUH-2) TaxID=1127134 RepID=H6R050_NOCCG|nr:phenylalanine--tRNA ligase subunit beta [Nocardia cyriacigeorgica]MBF6287225.1 phenylalanine--tRNA ligase subunit beta [Nocardia cyriacigeorgica]MBF6428378.1 phenylalanine--tRNA ligase subunit beta [Nocardia cyriacigeorgica]BDT86533.1 phenylalanine--tRNA ligase beta subunit [Nocardia cyriacigeorgica]CCF62913.1 Phenylalanyl-tRNA synthetase beta chain (Phenylalanine--tRNA ligase beta chain) (PheRS) [Nocardia cyriacigeorgica GUH-2]